MAKLQANIMMMLIDDSKHDKKTFIERIGSDLMTGSLSVT